MRCAGNLLKFALMPCQRHASEGDQELMRNQKFGALLADKAFDVQWLIEPLQAQGVPILIPQRPDRRGPLLIVLAPLGLFCFGSFGAFPFGFPFWPFSCRPGRQPRALAF